MSQVRTALLVHLSSSGQGSTEAGGHRARRIVTSSCYCRPGRSVADEDNDDEDDDFEDDDEDEDDEEDEEDDEEQETWQVGWAGANRPDLVDLQA